MLYLTKSHNASIWKHVYCTLFLQRTLEPLQRPIPTLRMINNRLGIPILLRNGRRTPRVWLMNSLARNITELRQPMPNVLALGVESLTLAKRIEDAEIGLRIDTGTRSESPSAVVGCEVSIDQILHEVPLAAAPVEHQILGQERGDHHPSSVVHPRAVAELAHGCVHDREAGFSIAPGLEDLLIILPFDVRVFGLEAFVHARLVSLVCGQDLMRLTR